MKFLLLLPSLVFFILFTVWPIVEVFRLSLFNTNFITSRFVGIQNYIDTFQNELFQQSLLNGIFYILLMVIGTTTISLLISLLVANLNKRWQDSTRILLYIPVLAGGVIIAQVWRWIFSSDGVVNWLLSLFGLGPIFWFSQGATAIPVVVFIVVLSSFGSYVIIFLASILSIDKSIFEAARIDGASDGQIRRLITIPILTPTIILVSLLAMIGALQIVETIMTLAPQSFAATPTYAIYMNGFKNSKWGMASAQSVILLLITVGLSILKRKVENRN